MLNYTNLEQRMMSSYIDMFPPFIPLAEGKASVQSQEHFYLFMKNFYQTIFNSPELFFKNIYEDDAYPNRFNRASYRKPKLINYMKRDLKEVDELIAQLFALGQNSTLDHGRLVISEEVAIKKKVLNVLPLFGLQLEQRILSCDPFEDLFPAWKWMATRENAGVIAFSRCMFDPEYPYIQTVFSPMFGDEEAFDGLAQYLTKNGYRRVDLERGAYTLDYVKQGVTKDVPLGSPLHGDPHHFGISAEYKPDAAIPQFLVLRIIEMKNLLLKFDQMPDHLKTFVIQTAKKCDQCGYCTQTDKSGKRNRQAIHVFHNGEYCICPLYPGFNFCFTALDEGLASNLIAFLEFMDRHISGAPL
jgi:hypothetical protein